MTWIHKCFDPDPCPTPFLLDTWTYEHACASDAPLDVIGSLLLVPACHASPIKDHRLTYSSARGTFRCFKAPIFPAGHSLVYSATRRLPARGWAQRPCLRASNKVW